MKSADAIRFEWTPSRTGGGGYITGLLQDPEEPQTLYARCDVAGVYKSEDGGRSWRAVNRGMTACHHHSVQSLAQSPRNPGVLLRGSGEARERHVFGTIHRSEDGGETWTAVTEQVDFYGNGPTRMYGETIAFDPHDPGTVLAGGYGSGIWISRDEGVSWRYLALRGERFSHLAFHPGERDVVFAGTIGDTALTAGGRENYIEQLHDHPRAHPGRIYRSRNGGATWELLLEGFSIAEFAFDSGNPLAKQQTAGANSFKPAAIYAACMDRTGIVRSLDGGDTWTVANDGLVPGKAYNTVAADPHTPGRLYTAPNFSREGEGEHAIPVYRSDDSGASWHIVRHHAPADVTGQPHYMKIWYAGLAIAKIRVDRRSPDRLLLCNWFGVYVSEDGGMGWSGHDFAGIENTCGESIVSDPANPHKVYVALADHALLISEDRGETFRHLDKEWEDRTTTAVAPSKSRPGFIVYGVGNPGKNGKLYRTFDDGKTAELCAVFEDGLYVQALTEDPHREGRFYAYLDGPLDRGAGLYASEDWGATWSRIPQEWPKPMRSLPHEQSWVEAELLSVVVYQVKNACGTNQLLACDPHSPDTLYVGERTEGLFKLSAGERTEAAGSPATGEGGPRWINIGAGLPFRRTAASVLNVIKADSRRPGILYAGFIREGLWRSADGGGTWAKLFPLDDDRPFNASSIAVAGERGEQLYVACEPLYWSQHESAVYYSGDYGATWSDITDRRLGAIRWKGLAVSADHRTVYGVSCGNGIFTATKKEERA